MATPLPNPFDPTPIEHDNRFKLDEKRFERDLTRFLPPDDPLSLLMSEEMAPIRQCIERGR